MNQAESVNTGRGTVAERKHANTRTGWVVVLAVLITLAAPAAARGSLYQPSLDIDRDQSQPWSDILAIRIGGFSTASLQGLTSGHAAATFSHSMEWNTTSASSGLRRGDDRNWDVTAGTALNTFPAGTDNTGQVVRISSSRAQTAMLSYLVSELFTGVDIYQDIRTFGKRVWAGSSDISSITGEDGGSWWNLNVTVTAANVAVKTTFRNGEMGFGVGSIKQGEVASAKLEIRF